MNHPYILMESSTHFYATTHTNTDIQDLYTHTTHKDTHIQPNALTHFASTAELALPNGIPSWNLGLDEFETEVNVKLHLLQSN